MFIRYICYLKWCCLLFRILSALRRLLQFWIIKEKNLIIRICKIIIIRFNRIAIIWQHQKHISCFDTMCLSVMNQITKRTQLHCILAINLSTMYILQANKIRWSERQPLQDSGKIYNRLHLTQNEILTKTTRKQTNAFGLFFACTAAVQVL